MSARRKKSSVKAAIRLAQQAAHFLPVGTRAAGVAQRAGGLRR